MVASKRSKLLYRCYLLTEGIFSAPEVRETNVNGGSRVGSRGGLVVTPCCPDLLACRIHDDHLSVSSLMLASDISVDDLRSDLAVVSLQDLTHTWVVRRLAVLVVEENAVHLRVCIGEWRDPALVVIELDPLLGVVCATEAVVWRRAPTVVNHHGSVGSVQSFFDVSKVVAELNGVAQNPHPWLTPVGFLGTISQDIVIDLLAS